MTDFRARYAGTQFQGLQSDPIRERAVDIVAAAGMAPSKGVDVWKVHGLETTAYSRLRRDLIKAFRERYKNENLYEKVCDQAIHEYFCPQCPTCNGTGRIGSLALNEPQEVCFDCGGVKVRRFSDSTRARTMQISYAMAKHLTHKIGWAVQRLSNLDIRVNQAVNRELERG